MTLTWAYDQSYDKTKKKWPKNKLRQKKLKTLEEQKRNILETFKLISHFGGCEPQSFTKVWNKNERDKPC